EIEDVGSKRGGEPLGKLEPPIDADVGVEHRRPKQYVLPTGAESSVSRTRECAPVVPLVDVAQLFRRGRAVGELADEGRVQPRGGSRRRKWESGTVVDSRAELPAAGYRGRHAALSPSLGLTEREFGNNARRKHVPQAIGLLG